MILLVDLSSKWPFQLKVYYQILVGEGFLGEPFGALVPQQRFLFLLGLRLRIRFLLLA